METTKSAGKLYIVATPIGNMEDITLRAIRILGEVDVIAAEDTRHSAGLLAHHGIGTPLVSCHEHNETERIPGLIRRLEAGESVALISDAGTPSVSDPGYRLAREAGERDIEVIPVPGVSAVITALSVSGLPTDTFTFIGFPPRKSGKRRDMLLALKNESRTLVFYESPRRILSFVEELLEIAGDRQAVLGREMTKLHEEFIRGPLSRIISQLQERPVVKGECTLLVSGVDETAPVLEIPVSDSIVQQEIMDALESEQVKISEISKKIAKKYGLPRKAVYEEALSLKKARSDQ